MSGRRDAVLYLFLAAAWGTSFVATKAALASVPPVVLAAVRFDLVAAVLFAVAALGGRDLRPRGRDDLAPILTGGLLVIGAHNALLFSGQQYVTSAVASTLLGLVPILTPVAARFLRPDERLARRGVAGLALGFLGVVLIADPDPTNLLADVRGVGFVFASAAVFVAGIVTTREERTTLDPVATQAWMALTGAALLHLAIPVLPGESLAAATVTPAVVGWVVYLAVVPGAWGFFVYFRLLERLGPLQMALLEYVIPPFAAGFGWLVLGEELTATTAYGFVAILAGFLLLKAESIRAALRRRGYGQETDAETRG